MKEHSTTLTSIQPRRERLNALSDDSSLIRMAQDGDMHAFGILVKKYEGQVLNLVFRLVGNEERSKDVTQEVFIKLYRFLPQFRLGNQLFTWLYRITVNACFDFLKKERRFKLVPLEDVVDSLPPAEEPDEGRSEMADKIRGLTDYLSTAQKTAFVLRHVEELPCKEIARIMDCPEGTIRSHLHHARKKLKQLFEKYYPDSL